ncbi:MAG TPA: protein kinase [Bryobacteraceae bacterium]|nr:protein kinase [Bryobacteraceae bacterium]
MEHIQQPDDELVMNLVEQALAQPEHQRVSYLQSACSGNTCLFDQAWKYVQWDERMHGFLLDPLFPPEDEKPFEPGQLLDGRFRIEREVARGGMGIVYEAFDEKLRRRIALKCAISGFRKRLPPEVRHASEISHPNVCKIFEIHTASTPDGQVDFLTMEFLEGETLAARLARGRLPETEARTIARQICAGLAEAHRNRVVHGDLKSNNVILAKYASGGVRAVITDFGLARVPLGPADDIPPGGAGSSQAGGTPDYMAPELWKGEKPSAASDVYALGVILYELAGGKREAPLEGGRRAPVNPGRGAILRRCLEADPAKRFHDAGEVAVALEPSRTLRWWLGVASAVLLALGVGVATYERATAPKESWRLAMLPIESPADTAEIASDLSRETSGQLRRLKGGSVARLTFVEASHGANEALRATHRLQVNLAKRDQKVLVHAVLTDARSGVPVKDWTTAYAPGDERRYAPVALAGMVTGALRLPALEVAAVNPRGARDYWDGVWYTRQNSTLDAALRALNQAVAEDPGSPLTHSALAEAQWFEYFLTKDQRWRERARESLREAEERDPDVPAAHRVEGYLYYADDLYSQAVLEFERAIELQPGNAMAHIYLAKAYEDNNQLDKAQAEFVKATEVEPKYFRTWQNLGAYYHNRSKFNEMAEFNKKAIELAPNEPNLHSNLGGAYLVLGQFSAAEQELRRSIDLRETIAADCDLGQILMYEGNDSEAVRTFQRALDLGSPPGGTPKYLVLMYLGIAQRRLHHVAESTEANTIGFKMVEAENPRNARDGDLKSFLGYFSATMGDRRHAIDYIETALGLFPDNSATRWRAVLTYEELYRQSRDSSLRNRALELVNQAAVDQIADLNRWPDVADLREDPRFKDIVASHQIK